MYELNGFKPLRQGWSIFFLQVDRPVASFQP
uniref:Uncharacterized protein n=1 Tax=Anguilla anguilla TaxID=7936 RepID=A0A0E9QZF8_ANGAN